MREITECVAIGDFDDAQLYYDGFTEVLCLVQQVPEEIPESKVTHIPLQDGENPQEQFNRAVDKVRTAIQSDTLTLVHCGAGASRSVGVTATALAVEQNSELQDCIDSCSLGHMNPHPDIINAGKVYIDSK